MYTYPHSLIVCPGSPKDMPHLLHADRQDFTKLTCKAACKFAGHVFWLRPTIEIVLIESPQEILPPVTSAHPETIRTGNSLSVGCPLCGDQMLVWQRTQSITCTNQECSLLGKLFKLPQIELEPLNVKE